METSNNARHLAELQRITVRFSDELQEKFLPLAETRLLEMADTAKNNEHQWRLLQLSRDLRRQKALLAEAFRKYLIEGFHQFQHNKLGGKDTSKEDMSQDLSLVANDELEQNLASSSLSRRAETRFAEELFALNQRMAVLQGGRKLADDGNPLGPYQFAEALQAEIAVLKLDTRLTVLFYRIFEKILLDNLGEVYKSANDYLIRNGILPNLRYGVALKGAKSNASAGSKPPEATTETSGEAAVASTPPPASPSSSLSTRQAAVSQPDPAQEIAQAGSLVTQRQLYSAIRDLQQGVAQARMDASQGTGHVSPAGNYPAGTHVSGRQDTGHYSPGYFSQPAYPAQGNAALAACAQSEVVTALSGVPLIHYAETIEQVAVPPAMTVEQFQAVTVQLREQIGDEKHIDDDDGRIIDLVGMIFEYMLADKQLPDSVKAVLSYLHTPYLKAAFLDRRLFEKPEHASRQLLNCMAEAGTRWVNSSGESQFKVFPKIKSVVRRILTEFNSDVALFDELFAEMQEFCQKVEHSVGLMERRAREKAEGEDRLREVKRRVMLEVRKRMQGHELPSHIIVLLLHPWSDYLTFTLLRHGQESVLWQEGLDNIEDIIWSIQPKVDANERNRLMLIQESLQSRVQSALETIAYDQVKSNKLLDALSKSQMLALQNLETEPVAAERRAEMEAEVGEGLEQEVVDLDAFSEEEREVIENLRDIEFGTWIEFDQLDQYTNMCAKVAWFNSKTSRYMLVDRSGKQVAMKSGIEIARMILGSQARMLAGSGKPFFERALENIFARLKSAISH